MPRYFFHVHDGRDHRDEEGTQLVNVGEARSEALKLLGALLAESAEHDWSSKEWYVSVTDRQGAPVVEVSLEAVSCVVPRFPPGPANNP
jgi:hypothetical protein